MSRITTSLGAAIIGASMIAAVPAGVFAATGTTTPAKHAHAKMLAHRRPFVYGQLTAKTDATATITSPVKGSVTVNLTAKTRFGSRDAAAKTAGIAVNDYVAVYGNRKKAIARIVRFDTVPFALPGRVRVAGAATATTSGLTVTLKSGKTVNVNFATKTHFRVNGKRASALPVLVSGQRVRVLGRRFTDGSVVASRVILRVK